MQSLAGSAASVRQPSAHVNNSCWDLLAGLHDDSKHFDDVADTDLHTPKTGLAVYAFATPFILIIGNRPTDLLDFTTRIVKNNRSKEEFLMKDRIAILSPPAAANGFVQPFLGPPESTSRSVLPFLRGP